MNKWDVLSILIATVSILCQAATWWYWRSHWPAHGFVRVPKELARERERKHFHDESLSDRTIATERKDDKSRVRTARMRGRRSYRKRM